MQDEVDETVVRPRRGGGVTGHASIAFLDATKAADTDDTIIVHRPLPLDVGPVAPAPEHPVPNASPPELVEPGRTPRAASGTPASGAPAEEKPALTPSVYRFVIAGTVVALDRIAFIGRKPSRPRVVRDGQARLVHVPSARNEVSSTHLEIRQRGLSVVVTDLKSTNGSLVNIPGLPPRNLRQGESMVVTPGTLVDIGDGILIEILPLQHQ